MYLKEITAVLVIKTVVIYLTSVKSGFQVKTLGHQLAIVIQYIKVIWISKIGSSKTDSSI